MKRIEIVPSDLSSGGSCGSDQASKIEFELPDSKLGKSGWTFSLASLIVLDQESEVKLSYPFA